MKKISLQTLQIHQLSDDQYKALYEKEETNPYGLYLTPFDDTDYARMKNIQELQETIQEMEGDIQEALNRIIEIQGAYLEGIPISFTINSVECEYEMGMTWEEWIESPYHDTIYPDSYAKLSVLDEAITNPSEEFLYAKSGEQLILVKASDKVGIYSQYTLTAQSPLEEV